MLRSHVLVMEFIGGHGTAATKLKDASLDVPRWQRAYLECIALIRAMFHKCKLVHADLRCIYGRDKGRHIRQTYKADIYAMFHKCKLVYADLRCAAPHAQAKR